MRLFSKTSKFFLATAATGLLSGCAANFLPNSVQTAETPVGKIQGTVHGGQYPVSGGHIYLYQAGTGGYGTGAQSIITAGNNTFQDGNGNSYVVTDTGGNFALGGDYTCTVGTQVYMVAVGGNPGLAGTNNNTAIVQMAGLGQCPAAKNLAAQVPYLTINEVTTVAFAYSMGGFATTAYNVSSDAGVVTNANASIAATAIANAMANAGKIVNLQYGQAPAAANGNPNSINPQQKIYALANILAQCVNTTDAGSTNCTNLFSYATSDGTATGTPATNEAEAIFNIVHNPAGAQTALIWRLNSPLSPFTPSLGTQPDDWALPVVYTNAISPYHITGTTIDGGPFNLVADASGNMWVGDEGRGAVEITPLGVASNHDTDNNGVAFGKVKGVAVASSGAIWVSDATNNQMTILDSSGNATFTTTAGKGGVDGPAGIAFDSAGSAFVANDTGNSMSIFNSSGAPNKGVAYTIGNLSAPAWVAVDSLGDAFTPSQSNDYIGTLATGKNSGTGINVINAFAYALTIDGSDNIWTGNNSATAPWYIYEFTCTQTHNGNGSVKGVDCPTNYTSYSNQGGMNIPDRLAMDGGGTLWIANQGAITVSALNTITTKWIGTKGLSTGATDDCLDATPDISGNIWTANKDGSVSELLGAGTPTLAPYVPGNYQKKP